MESYAEESPSLPIFEVSMVETTAGRNNETSLDLSSICPLVDLSPRTSSSLPRPNSTDAMSSRCQEPWEDSHPASMLEPIFQIPSLCKLEVDLGNPRDLFSSIVCSSASLKHLSIYDDETDACDVFVRPQQDIPGLEDSLHLPVLPCLCNLVSYSSSLRTAWISSMHELFMVAPNLTHLSLSAGDPASNFPVSFDISLRSLTSLQSLELRGFKNIASLSCIPALTRLTSLLIAGACPEKGKSTALVDISQSSSILHLAITYSPEISDADIRTIVKRMSQLEELDLTSLPRVTDRTLKRLSKPGKCLNNLNTIRLKYCPLITPTGILSLLNLKKLYQIVTTVQPQFLYSQDQTVIDTMFSKFNNNFIAIN